MRSFIGSTLSIVAGLLVPALAVAQSPATDRDKAEAKTILKEGAALYDAGDTAGALARFDRAYAKFPAPIIQFDRAQALRAMGRPIDAATALDAFLGGPTEAVAERRREAEEQLKRLDETVGHLRILSEVAGAEVVMDGTPVGKTPFAKTLRAMPGTHEVAISKQDFASYRIAVVLEAGHETTLSAALTPLIPVAATPAPSSPPTAEVEAAPAVDTAGSVVVVAPSPALAGSAADGWLTGRRAVSLASAGAGVVGVTVGAIFGLRARSKNNEALGLCASGTCATKDELDRHATLVDDARTARTASIVGFIAGGAALAAGAVLFLMPSSKDVATTTAHLVPSLEGGQAGLRFACTF